MNETTRIVPDTEQPPRKALSETAQRALAEAQARREAARLEAMRVEALRVEAMRPKEIQGPTGPEPTRYGDWETKGIASDF